MSLQKLYQTKDGGYLSPRDCQEINISLAKIKLGGIPDEQRDNVKDYLTNALSMNSVENSLIEELENLLSNLRQQK